MIWNGIISVVVSILTAIINLFPLANSAVLTSISGSLAPFKAYLANADWLFPVGTFFTMVGYILTIEATIMLIKIVHWLAKNITAGWVK